MVRKGENMDHPKRESHKSGASHSCITLFVEHHTMDIHVLLNLLTYSHKDGLSINNHLYIIILTYTHQLVHLDA